MISKIELDDLLFNYRQKDVFVLGFEQVKKLLKNDLIEVVILAKNVSKEMKEDINYYAKLGNVKVVDVDLNNVQLGTYLKKPFSVSVVGVKRE